MSMLDWNAYRGHVLAGVGEIAKLSPDTFKGYAALSGAGAKTGHLAPPIAETTQSKTIDAWSPTPLSCRLFRVRLPVPPASATLVTWITRSANH